MARYVENYSNNKNCNSYGRNAERIRSKEKVISAYGKINSVGVCPDGSSCINQSATSEVEFSLNIYKKGNEYQGEVYIVNYDTRRKVNSNELIYYHEHEGDYVLCVFYVRARALSSNCCCPCNYELTMHLTPSGCNSGSLFAYAAPIYNDGMNIGGPLSSGEINFYNLCSSNDGECSSSND